MLDQSVFNLIKDQDLLMQPPLRLRPYVWGSLDVYQDGVKDRMSKYLSKYDLLHWMTFWTEEERLASPFVGDEGYEAKLLKSSQIHQSLMTKIFTTPIIEDKPHTGYDIWNAIDTHIVDSQCADVHTVLDFGAGYGRLGAMFSNDERGGSYIAVDCVEVSYLLQNLFLSSMAPERFHEYMDYAIERRPFAIETQAANAIYHVPSWKMNLVPDASVDVITSVFVLPEVNDFALLEFVEQARRVVRQGGYIYIRDHLYHNAKSGHLGGHRQDTPSLLEAAGFKLIYQGKYRDNIDIYGTPRVYQNQS